MADLAKASNHELSTIVFNGQKVHVGNSVTDDPPSEVLKRYQAYCDNNASFSDDDASEKEEPFGPEDHPETEKAGTLRVESATPQSGDGAVICFVKGEATKASRDEAFEAFLTTGELGAIGELRYAYARKSDSGRTLVLTAWTDSKFNLLDIVPKGPDEDVRGDDFPEIPRPGKSVRVLSARAEGTPYAANIYRTSDRPAQVLAFYDGAMQERGWFMFDPELTDDDGGYARAYMKDAVVLIVTTRVDDDGSTYASLGLSGVTADDKIGRR
jgi:hypothetical protein